MKYLFTVIAISVVGVATIGCSGGLSEAEINQLIQTRVDARVKAEVSAAVETAVSAALKNVKQGPQGATGPMGKTGPIGVQGVAGPIGSTGGKGDKGSTGQRGGTGATGLGAEDLEYTLFGYSGSPYGNNVFGELEDSVDDLEYDVAQSSRNAFNISQRLVVLETGSRNYHHWHN